MKKAIFLLVFSLFLISCTTQESPSKTEDITSIEIPKIQKDVIYTSFYPLYFLTKGLVGENYEVINLVPDGGEPHEYEPTPKQVKNMLGASYVVMNGLEMEHYEEKLSAELEKNKVPFTHLSEKLENLIELDEGTEEHKGERIEEHKDDEHGHGSTDPHTWLSPKMMKELALLLAQELKISDSIESQAFLKKLVDLDTRYSKTLALCQKKELVTSHEAFGYLARDYGLTQVAVSGIEPNMDPSSQDIARVIEVIRDKKITTIFTEPLVSSKFTDTITQETGVLNSELAPLETLSPEEIKAGEDYISIMEKNLEKIADGLLCK